MLPRPSIKLIVASVIWLLLLGAVLRGVIYIDRFPETHPDETLEIEEKIIVFFQRITLPIKLAKLSRQERDTQLLIPLLNRRVSDIADTWGAPRGDNGERQHEGQDIFSPRGTPIFSATRGFITRITEEALGGNSVYVTGAGGVDYFYTHLDRFPDGVNVGDPVTPDTVIGFVGNSGNASTTPTHLHFGVYLSEHEPVDPLPLMVDR